MRKRQSRKKPEVKKSALTVKKEEARKRFISEELAYLKAKGLKREIKKVSQELKVLGQRLREEKLKPKERKKLAAKVKRLSAQRVQLDGSLKVVQAFEKDVAKPVKGKLPQKKRPKWKKEIGSNMFNQSILANLKALRKLPTNVSRLTQKDLNNFDAYFVSHIKNLKRSRRQAPKKRKGIITDYMKRLEKRLAIVKQMAGWLSGMTIKRSKREGTAPVMSLALAQKWEKGLAKKKESRKVKTIDTAVLDQRDIGRIRALRKNKPGMNLQAYFREFNVGLDKLKQLFRQAGEAWPQEFAEMEARYRNLPRKKKK